MSAHPHDYPHRSLLLVSGTSPQVVTETLYALTQIQTPAFHPTQVHLITTSVGAEQARLNLLDGPGYFFRLAADYGLDSSIFSPADIHIIENAHGQPLSDIRSPADNAATADFITHWLHRLTDNNDTAVHVSMAGGRKTMGYYAGYGLSLFGRPQDRLSHVLISEGYEGLQDFYYPTRQSHTIHNRQGRALDASQAKVTLAEIPFVRLRDGLPRQVLQGDLRFIQAVEQARLAARPHLILYPQQKSLAMNGVAARLSGTQFALLLWAAVRHQPGEAPIAPVASPEEGRHHRQQDISELLNLADTHWLNLDMRTINKLETDGLQQDWLETNISKANSALQRQLGDELANACRLASRLVGKKRGYSLPQRLTLDIEL